MNDRLFRTILKRYEADIEDANYKILFTYYFNLVVSIFNRCFVSL